MQKKLLPLIFLAFVFLSSTVGMLWFKTEVYEAQQENRACKDPYCNEERSIAVVVNGDRPEGDDAEVLHKLLTQKYTHYRVVYIANTERDIMRSLPRKHLITRKEKGAKSFDEHLYETVHELPDHTIVLALGERERVLSSSALTSINRYYSNGDMWCSYGSAESAPSKPYSIRELKKSAASLSRIGPCVTFLASAYKKIPLKELVSHGLFMERGFLRPLFSLAKERACYIQEPLFSGVSYNCYAHLESIQPKESIAHPSCDLVVFSYNRPLQLRAHLESVRENIRGLNSVFVLYRSEERFTRGYERLETLFPEVTFVPQGSDFKQTLVDLVFSGRYAHASHIMFSVDDSIAFSDVDVATALSLMEKTHAYGFFLRLGRNIEYSYTRDAQIRMPPSYQLEEGALAFCFNEEAEEGDWRCPTTLDMTIYRRDQLESPLRSIDYKTPTELEALWRKQADLGELGLCFSESKSVNIPINAVATIYQQRHMAEYTPEELMDVFDKGYKIDWHSVENLDTITSCHEEIDFEFISE